MATNPKLPTKYTGPDQYYIPSVNQPQAKQTDPTSGDYKDPLTGMIYNLGTIWLNAATNTPWMFGGNKTWFKLASAAGADVAGPASATDNAIARFDGTTGKVIQNSAATIADTTGAFATGSGTAALPSYSFTGDTDIGMFRIAANRLGFATNGTLGFEIDATQNLVASGNVVINGAAKQLQVHGGAETDFIGQTGLALGTATINNTNIAATDRIMIQRASVGASTTLGELVYSISAGVSFTIESRIIGTPGSVQTGDLSVVVYHIIRQV